MLKKLPSVKVTVLTILMDKLLQIVRRRKESQKAL